MFWNIIKVTILTIIIIAIAWVGLSVYSCYDRQQPTNQYNIPAGEEAAYSVYIENTRNVILTNDYEVHGSEVGRRVFILRGFWELRGQEFKYVEGAIVLDEAIFGEITLKKR